MKNINLIDLPFIGRKNEISLLSEKTDAAFSNKGSCLLITGEPGIGKSRLIGEFLAHLKNGVLALRINIESGISKQRDIAEEVIKSYLHGAVHSSRIITRIIDPTMYREFKQSIPELGIHYPFDMESMDPAGELPDVKEMFYQFLNNLSSLSPVILIIDGFDHLDEDGQAMIEYLLLNISTMPVFLILAGQDQPGVQQWLERVIPASVDKLVLRRLDRKEISQVNQLLFQNSLDYDFFEWIADKTGGLPLFLKEFLFALFEKGIIFYDSEHEKWRVIESYSRVKIPDRIDDMIRERLKRLSKPEIDLLKTAAIMGVEFDARSPLLRPWKDRYHRLCVPVLFRKKAINLHFPIP